MQGIEICPQCGLLYVLPRDKCTHIWLHKRMHKAVQKFGPYYSYRDQENMKKVAYAILYSEQPLLKDVLVSFEKMFKAYFSRSLRGSSFSLQHPDYKTYVSMLLNQDHWRKNFIPHPEAYEVMLKKYGKSPGIDEGMTYFKLRDMRRREVDHNENKRLCHSYCE